MEWSWSEILQSVFSRVLYDALALAGGIMITLLKRYYKKANWLTAIIHGLLVAGAISVIIIARIAFLEHNRVNKLSIIQRKPQAYASNLILPIKVKKQPNPKPIVEHTRREKIELTKKEQASSPEQEKDREEKQPEFNLPNNSGNLFFQPNNNGAITNNVTDLPAPTYEAKITSVKPAGDFYETKILLIINSKVVVPRFYFEVSAPNLEVEPMMDICPTGSGTWAFTTGSADHKEYVTITQAFGSYIATVKTRGEPSLRFGSNLNIKN